MMIILRYILLPEQMQTNIWEKGPCIGYLFGYLVIPTPIYNHYKESENKRKTPQQYSTK